MNCPDCGHGIEFHYRGDCYYGGEGCACKRSVDAILLLDEISVLKAELAQYQWIPVTERLPENRVGRLVCDKAGNVTRMYYDAARQCWIDFMGWEHTFGITHWMPLPPLPKDTTE